MSQFITMSDYDSSIHQEILSAIIRADEAVIEVCEDQAIAEMKGYLSSRYDVTAIFAATGTTRHSLILMFAKDIALFHIHSAHNPMKFPQIRKDRYDRAIEWLSGVRKGNINPDGLPLLTNPDGLRGGETNFLMSSNQKRVNHY